VALPTGLRTTRAFDNGRRTVEVDVVAHTEATLVVPGVSVEGSWMVHIYHSMYVDQYGILISMDWAYSMSLLCPNFRMSAFINLGLRTQNVCRGCLGAY
jgi:hypothetical protein